LPQNHIPIDHVGVARKLGQRIGDIRARVVREQLGQPPNPGRQGVGVVATEEQARAVVTELHRTPAAASLDAGLAGAELEKKSNGVTIRGPLWQIALQSPNGPHGRRSSPMAKQLQGKPASARRFWEGR
jgi:hypothetical protein